MITCGACKAPHDSTEEVKACYAKKYNGFTGTEIGGYEAGYSHAGEPSATQLQAVDFAGLQASLDHHPSVVRQIPNGYFTVVFGDDDRITLRVQLQEADARFAPGKQIVSYLSGPDNTADYRGFAFADPRSGRVNFWKRFQGNDRLDLAVRTLAGDPEAAGLAYAEESGNCWMCGRLLTVPASIHRGLGPICAKKGWM